MDVVLLSRLTRMMLSFPQGELTVYLSSALFVSCCSPDPPHTHIIWFYFSLCSLHWASASSHVSSALNANCMELFTLKIWIMIDAFLNSSVLSCPSLVGPCSFQTLLFYIYNPVSSSHRCGYTAPSAPAD